MTPGSQVSHLASPCVVLGSQARRSHKNERNCTSEGKASQHGLGAAAPTQPPASVLTSPAVLGCWPLHARPDRRLTLSSLSKACQLPERQGNPSRGTRAHSLGIDTMCSGLYWGYGCSFASALRQYMSCRTRGWWPAMARRVRG